MKYEIGDLKNYVKIIGKKLGFFLWILINFKDDFLKFNFLFWLFSKKKHDYIICSQSIIFKMHNFFYKHVWLICSWIVNRWIVCREIARAQLFFSTISGKFHWNKWKGLPPIYCCMWNPVSLVSMSFKLLYSSTLVSMSFKLFYCSTTLSTNDLCHNYRQSY